MPVFTPRAQTKCVWWLLLVRVLCLAGFFTGRKKESMFSVGITGCWQQGWPFDSDSLSKTVSLLVVVAMYSAGP